MADVELTNMVMVRDPDTGKVLVQDRIKSWKGLSFPGGHVEPFESFVDSAVREVREETGLTVTDLRACGVIHWCHSRTNVRYLVFCYRTEHFSGTLLEATDEGRVFWVDPAEIPQYPTSNDFEKYLPLFLSETPPSEAFGLWSEDAPWDILYR